MVIHVPQRSPLLMLAGMLAVFQGVDEILAAESPAEGQTGVIEGVVVYQADANRPWRYARYYVKDRKAGELAEAVVALEGPGLKNLAPSRESATAVVDQKNFTFAPETTAIRTGDSVKFLNSDQQLHNVKAFHLLHSFNVNMPAGDAHTETFKNATGLKLPYHIGCVYHSAMRAWVFVFDHPWFQVTDTAGRFRLEDVPPGRYTLGMVHPAGELRWNGEIEVKAGAVTAVTISVSPDNKPGTDSRKKEGQR